MIIKYCILTTIILFKNALLPFDEVSFLLK
jgi:hypothetical protein